MDGMVEYDRRHMHEAEIYTPGIHSPKSLNMVEGDLGFFGRGWELRLLKTGTMT